MTYQWICPLGISPPSFFMSDDARENFGVEVEPGEESGRSSPFASITFS